MVPKCEGPWDAQHRGCSGSVCDPSPLMVHSGVPRACFHYCVRHCQHAARWWSKFCHHVLNTLCTFAMHGCFCLHESLQKTPDSERGVVLNYFDGGSAFRVEHAILQCLWLQFLSYEKARFQPFPLRLRG